MTHDPRRPAQVIPGGGVELIHKLTVYLVVFGVLTGLGLCLTVAHDNHNHQSGTPWAASHTAQACATSVVLSERQTVSMSQALMLSLSTEPYTFYESISIRPPSPPPRS